MLELQAFDNAPSNFNEMGRIKSLHIACFCQVSSAEINKPLLEASVAWLYSIRNKGCWTIPYAIVHRVLHYLCRWNWQQIYVRAYVPRCFSWIAVVKHFFLPLFFSWAPVKVKLANQWRLNLQLNHQNKSVISWKKKSVSFHSNGQWL